MKTSCFAFRGAAKTARLLNLSISTIAGKFASNPLTWLQYWNEAELKNGK
jgi:hypothetical protein